MLVDQHFFRPGAIMCDERDKVPLLAYVVSNHGHDAKAHELADAIAAVVIGAHAGLNWLSAQPQNLEEVRQTLSSIANNGKRAYEMLVELRALMIEGVHGG